LSLVTVDELGKQVLEGIPDQPGYELGCLNDPPCRELLECILKEKCGAKIANTECYCGTEQASIDSCENESFKPQGPCREQIKAAYKSQFGTASDPSNFEIVSTFFDTGLAPGRPYSFFIPETLFDVNLFRNPLAERLKASNVPDEKIVSCVKACGDPPWK